MNDESSQLLLKRGLGSAQQTKALELGRAVLGRVAAIFERYFQGQAALLIADRNTFSAAGKTVYGKLKRNLTPLLEPLIFEEAQLHADHRLVLRIETFLKSKPEAIAVAVGSGTINDLAKLAAHRCARPYMAVATAASMDGYLAYGASITVDGWKQTIPCPAPLAVVADLDVLCAAPAALNAAGYADLLAKTTAGADWLLADALNVEPLHRQAWELAQSGLRDALAEPLGVRRGEFEPVRLLAEGLMLSGLAMQCASSSRPASGAEHQFSHLWDMQNLVHQGVSPLHGFKVGIGTLAIAALYEKLLELSLRKIDIESCCDGWPSESAQESEIRNWFGNSRLADIAVEESRAKHVSREALGRQLERLSLVWPQLRERLRQQLLPFAEVRQRLSEVGAPFEPEQIGVSRERWRDSFRPACSLRRRFTVLDLAQRANLLEDVLQRMFKTQGPF